MIPSWDADCIYEFSPTFSVIKLFPNYPKLCQFRYWQPCTISLNNLVKRWHSYVHTISSWILTSFRNPVFSLVRSSITELVLVIRNSTIINLFTSAPHILWQYQNLCNSTQTISIWNLVIERMVYRWRFQLYGIYKASDDTEEYRQKLHTFGWTYQEAYSQWLGK